VLVTGSEPDEILTTFVGHGLIWERSHSEIYKTVKSALKVANRAEPKNEVRAEWCAACLDDANLLDPTSGYQALRTWRERFFNSY
jgi:hypothetical protein